MNTPIDNIIVNPCQYTPVYIIENPTVSQTTPIVVTTSAQKPQHSNLKAFYENSGKLENNLLQRNENIKTPRIIKKVDNNVIGNNLKLANFLMAKNEFKIETVSEQPSIPYNNIVLKPLFVTNTPSSTNIQPTLPKLDVRSKIVRVKDIPIAKQKNRKILPKMTPKEETIAKPSKTTSVQLIKLGETYHCLNDLNDEQMKKVNHALKIFNSPKNSPKELSFDPATNTQYIYKVLSPKDIVPNNKDKEVLKPKKPEIKKEIKKVEKIVPEIEEEEPVIPIETTITRSGRKVRLPKNILPEETTLQKPKKKSGTIVTCNQCSLQFNSLYRLRRHYDHHPTHVPAPGHTNLFHCLLAIIKTGTEDEQANIFLQQLEQFIAKIRSLIPCFIKSDSLVGKLNTIGEDVANLFGIDPGKYNLNVSALSCNKDKDGHCQHNPPPPHVTSEASPLDSHKGAVDIPQTDDCARNNSADKWPTVSKRLESRKNPEQGTSKKIKLSDAKVPLEQCELDDVDIDAFFSNTHKTESPMDIKTETREIDISDQLQTNLNQDLKKQHLKFHSTHFDIRSSPIKPTSTVFTKFQINPEKLPKFDMQEIQPLINQESYTEQVHTQANIVPSLEIDLFTQNNSLPCKEMSDISLHSSKDWSLKYMDNESNMNYVKADSIINDSTDYLKSNGLIEPALLHVKDDSKLENGNAHENNLNENLSHQDSVLSLLSYPEATIRNSTVDFSLDLFSFSNS
ncbi:unnamed protein product [Pieris brassicae]|uniref:C2H2-type domain-containing protein n=1 Tax=Pieris brassicae TaxID=7116 RepID=A0A9P0TV44_PIEBR|nr:unnamed protein product [Pieris brassicae]